jgi:hypothetical protein
MELDLLITRDINAELVFFQVGGSKEIVEAVKAKARDFMADPETPEGRKAFASQAYKIRRSKTFLDDAGKEFKAQWKAKIDLVDAERKYIRDSLDALEDEIKAPLTEYCKKQEAEALRLAEQAQREREAKEAEERAKTEAIQAQIRADQEKNRLEREAIEAEKAKIKEREEAIKREAEWLERSKRIEAENAKRDEARKIKEKAQAEESARIAEENKILKSKLETEAKAKAEAKAIQDKAEADARAVQAKAEAEARAKAEALSKDDLKFDEAIIIEYGQLIKTCAEYARNATKLKTKEARLAFDNASFKISDALSILRVFVRGKK